MEHNEKNMMDIQDIKGCGAAKRALEIAAAGGHGILLMGYTGSGKVALAQRVNSLLPEMSHDEYREFRDTLSLMLGAELPFDFDLDRPFRAPHRTVSSVAMQETINLAKHGVLLLDEFVEFDPSVFEGGRVAGVDGRFVLPDTMVVGTAVKCACGMSGHPNRKCECAGRSKDEYNIRLNKRAFNVFDMRVNVWKGDKAFDGMDSATVRLRVEAARKIQRDRYKNDGITVNAQMEESQIDSVAIEQDARLMLDKMKMAGVLSSGEVCTVIRVARTIADLNGQDKIASADVMAAIVHRAVEMVF